MVKAKEEVHWESGIYYTCLIHFRYLISCRGEYLDNDVSTYHLKADFRLKCHHISFG